MVLQVVLAILVLIVLAGGVGFGLFAAARALATPPRRGIPSILNELPGTDCGACGFPTCEAYAEAINDRRASFDRCEPGGPAVADAIEVVLQRRKRTTRPESVVQVHCRGGGNETRTIFSYHGMRDCNALFALYEGNLACKEACLGLGSCIRACPHGAIGYDPAGKVWVSPERCTGCGSCIPVCPTGVLKWVPIDADVVIACNNHDPGDRVEEICAVGCTGCRLCERRSPGAGYAVSDHLAHISYGAGGNRLPGARACPPGCIVTMDGERNPPQSETVAEANEED